MQTDLSFLFPVEPRFDRSRKLVAILWNQKKPLYRSLLQNCPSVMEDAKETKIIYHIDDEDTPYLIKLPIPADRVTLGDFKNALNRPNFKFFFKSMDDDFG